MANKTVYAVIGSIDFGGHTTPLGIFTDWDMAVACQDRNSKRRPKRFDDVDIYEYELDIESDGTLF